MDFKVNSNVLTICLTGRIDTSNAQTTEEQINEIKQTNPHDNIVLDLDGLEYISSAGLRILLRLRKECEGLTAINASSEVFDIFEMTGFAEMIPVSKAMRKVDVTGCEVIGKGAKGAVYRLDPETIIKVHFDQSSALDFKQEQAIARKAFVLGVPTAIPYDIVKVDEGYGMVFELINADSLGKLMSKDPDNIDKYIKINADLIKSIHSIEGKKGEFPNISAQALRWVTVAASCLEPNLGDKLLNLYDAIPEDNHLIHGDFHSKNIMMQGDEALLIDMDDFSEGYPLFELGSIYNTYVGRGEVNGGTSVEKFLDIPYDSSKKVWHDTLDIYLDHPSTERFEEVENACRVIGYSRLIRHFSHNREENAREVEFFTNALADVLSKTEKLNVF